MRYLIQDCQDPSVHRRNNKLAQDDGDAPDDLAPPEPPKLAKIQRELREKRLARADAEEARLRQQFDGLG